MEKSHIIEEFIRNFRVLSVSTLNHPYFINQRYGSRVVVDKQGLLWIYEANGRNCVPTTVNVENGKFRTSGCGGEEGFYFICEDGTGLHFAEDDIYYLIDEEYSGWGTAFDHFTQFPDGDSREASKQVDDAMLQWALEHCEGNE